MNKIKQFWGVLFITAILIYLGKGLSPENPQFLNSNPNPYLIVLLFLALFISWDLIVVATMQFIISFVVLNIITADPEVVETVWDWPHLKIPIVLLFMGAMLADFKRRQEQRVQELEATTTKIKDENSKLQSQMNELRVQIDEFNKKSIAKGASDLDILVDFRKMMSANAQHLAENFSKLLSERISTQNLKFFAPAISIIPSFLPLESEVPTVLSSYSKNSPANFFEINIELGEFFPHSYIYQGRLLGHPLAIIASGIEYTQYHEKGYLFFVECCELLLQLVQLKVEQTRNVYKIILEGLDCYPENGEGSDAKDAPSTLMTIVSKNELTEKIIHPLVFAIKKTNKKFSMAYSESKTGTILRVTPELTAEELRLLKQNVATGVVSWELRS